MPLFCARAFARAINRMLVVALVAGIPAGVLARPAIADASFAPDIAEAREAWKAATEALAEAVATLDAAQDAAEAASANAADAVRAVAAARTELTERKREQAAADEAVEAATAAVAERAHARQQPRPLERLRADLSQRASQVAAAAVLDGEAPVQGTTSADIAQRSLDRRLRKLEEAEVAAEDAAAALVEHEALVDEAVRDAAVADAAVEDAEAAVASAQDVVTEHQATVDDARSALSMLGRRAGVPGSDGLIWPADGELTSQFGMRGHPVTGQARNHDGIDISAPIGQPVLAAAAGTVTFAGVRGGYGNTVEIDHGGGRMTRYAHLSTMDVSEGLRVAEGERIAAVGTTGLSSGPHLHWEVLQDGSAQDPLMFFPAQP